jgi:hypothetical protein
LKQSWTNDADSETQIKRTEASGIFHNCDKPTPSVGTPISRRLQDNIFSEDEPRDYTGYAVGKIEAMRRDTPCRDFDCELLVKPNEASRRHTTDGSKQTPNVKTAIVTTPIKDAIFAQVSQNVNEEDAVKPTTSVATPPQAG